MTTKSFMFSLLAISVFIFGYYGFLIYSKRQLTQTPTPVSTNIPEDTKQNYNEYIVNYELPKGEQLYNVSHGKEVTGPRMNQIIFNPLSFELGDNQKIKVVFPEKEQVGSVVIFVTTDKRENQKVTLTKDSKINSWSGEWSTNDSIKSRYSVRIVAVGAAGEYNNTMNFL